jgi:hypothetical protein
VRTVVARKLHGPASAHRVGRVPRRFGSAGRGRLSLDEPGPTGSRQQSQATPHHALRRR